jgi:hypothetical protein
MRTLARAGLWVVLGVLLAACSPYRATWVDQAAEVVVDGQRYQVIGSDQFVIDRDQLEPNGTAESVPSGLAPDVFRFPDISMTRALVVYAADGVPFLLVPASLRLPAPSADGSDPLAAAIPELCGYWRPPKPSECGDS